MNKPLNGPAYGSIGHLPTSRLGPGDHRVPQGQADICTIKCRPGDKVFIEEKLDGSCCAVYKDVWGNLQALTRAGYNAASSPFEQHWLFAAWVLENKWRFDSLPVECRLVGEWIAQAHGTLYETIEPFWPFDLFLQDGKRAPRYLFDVFVQDRAQLPRIWRLNQDTPVHIDVAFDALLATYMKHYPVSTKPEGLVYRVERNGKFDFLAKWVRPDKQDGIYLPEVSGNPAVWNWGPRKDKT